MDPVARREIEGLTDPLVVGNAEYEARSEWLRNLVLGDVHSEIDESTSKRAYQISLLSGRAQLEYDPENSGWYDRVDAFAETISLHSMMEDEAGPRLQLRRLAARIFLIAMQPIKAFRAGVELRDANPPEGDDPVRHLEHVLTRQLGYVVSLGGKRTVQQSVDDIQDAVSGSPLRLEQRTNGDPLTYLDDLARETLDLGMARAHRIVRDLQVFARYRFRYDTVANLGNRLPTEFLEACTAGPMAQRRAELLPHQLWAVDNGLLDSGVVSISTPTGSGKTFMAELRIAAELQRNPQALCIYVAPFNALAGQVRRELTDRIGASGHAVTIWTGAYELAGAPDGLGSVLVTTPEKLDYVIRSRLDDDELGAELLARASLFIFDESHLIALGVRGIRYEFLITRLRRLLPDAGFVTMSAVQENVDAFGQWISGGRDRPLVAQIDWSPAEIHDVLWRTNGSLEFRRSGDAVARLQRPGQPKEAAALLTATLLEELQSVLLVDTQKPWVESLAKYLYSEYEETLTERLDRNVTYKPDGIEQLSALASKIRRSIHPDLPLADYVELGLAYHHAGLPTSIRSEIENLAREEVIHTLVSTTTLAEGVNLPFRAVILVHLNLPGGPVPVSTLRNLRGRAARPFHANEGVFFIIQPKNTNTSYYQYFLDRFWEMTVERPESMSGLLEVMSHDIVTRNEAVRTLQAQLLALFSERELEPDEVGLVANETYLAALVGQDRAPVVQLGRELRNQTSSMLEPPALVQAASPVNLTRFGRAVTLGGISADSGRFVRALLLKLGGEKLEELSSERGPSWLGIRLAWLPWEGAELTNAYERARFGRRSPRGLIRDVDALETVEDHRFRGEYELCDLLLEPLTYAEIAERAENSLDLIRGQTWVHRLVNVIEWAGSSGPRLAWTLTGTIRVLEALGEEADEFVHVGSELRPLVQALQSWLPWESAIALVDRGLDRDSAIEVVRANGLQNLERTETESWLESHPEVLDG